MIKKIFLVLVLVIGFNNIVYSEERKCDEFRKFSMDYMKCKANSLKNKSISAGKNFAGDTK